MNTSFTRLFQPTNDLVIVVSCRINFLNKSVYVSFLPSFLPSFLLASLSACLPVLNLLFVSVFNIASLPQEVCHRICDPWWCAAIIGSAAAISSGYWLFDVFVLFSLQRRCNGKGNDVSNLLLLRLVIGLMKSRDILSQSDCYDLLALIFLLLALAA